MNYPAEDSKGKQLFQQLEERSDKNLYDDEFLHLLIEYQRMYPESEHFDIFYAKYAIAAGNFQVALEYAQKALEKRRLSLEAWKLLMACYMSMGETAKALVIQGYCCNLYGQPLQLSMSRQAIEEALPYLSLAMGRSNYAPLSENRMFLTEAGLSSRKSVFGGEYLPIPADRDGYPYWVGVYNEMSGQGSKGIHLEREMKADAPGFFDGDDFVYDIMRSKVVRELTLDPKGTPVVLPIAATATQKQRIEFQSREIRDSLSAGQWEYSFLRVEQKTRFTSKQPFAVGRPIYLRHSGKRKRLVLSILVDALSWNAFRFHRERYLPNIMEFFSKGVIFDQHFSVSEYTYPSLATIETGLYPHNSQIFHERAAVWLKDEYRTLSEQMKELGYYCVNLLGAGDGVYNGASRGYDRLLVNYCDLPAYVGVERAIRQMEAFSECDLFLFLHIGEVHPWPAGSLPFPAETQTKLSLKERVRGLGVEKVSVNLPDAPVYQDANRRGMLHVDRSMGELFSYLLSHYKEEEYIVQLYSDHGVSIYDKEEWILGENQTSAAYMLRGSGIPSCGMVEELTSTVDIYPILAKLADFSAEESADGNLPAVFGGRERDHVISYSLFPGQTYKLCIRTKSHEFCLESVEPVVVDGTVDLSHGKISVFIRDGRRRQVQDPSVNRRFLELAKVYTEKINNGGRQWRSMPKP